MSSATGWPPGADMLPPAETQPVAATSSTAVLTLSRGATTSFSRVRWPRLLVVTWNVSCTCPNDMDLAPLLTEADTAGCVAICLQETKNLDTKHVLGEGRRRAADKMSRSRVASFIMGHKVDELRSPAAMPPDCVPRKASPWEAPILDALGRLGDFVVLARSKLVGLRMTVIVRRELLGIIHDIRCGAIACGSVGLGNKGATGCGFMLGDTSVAIVNGHLAAGSGMKMFAPDDREQNYYHILGHLALKPVSGGRHKRRLNQYDVVVWAGDTNSRLKLSKSQIDSVLVRLESGPDGISELLTYDEITCSRKDGRAFKPFREAPITFPPTYKCVVNGDGYDVGQTGSGPKRVPAWCDRVLFRGPVRSLMYQHCPLLKTSDHRPVVALLEFGLEHRPDTEEPLDIPDGIDSDASPGGRLDEGPWL